MKKEGVDLSVVLAIATNPHQQTAVNNYAIVMDKESDIAAFGSVHPDAPNALEELERLKAAGIKGIKFHPEYQGFYADDEKMKPIYRKISELGLITLFHTGEDYGFSPPYHATPDRMVNALRWFDSPVVAAHWGGGGYYRQVLDQLCGQDIWFDLSFGYGAMPRHYAQTIIDNIPYVATMIPVIASLAVEMGCDPTVFYFGLLSGATSGGNCTPIGASANITGIGILRKEGYEVQNADFFKIGIPFTLAAIIPAYLYLWIFYGA